MKWVTPYDRTQQRYQFAQAAIHSNKPKYQEGDRLTDAMLALVTDGDCVIRCDCGKRYFTAYKTLRNRMNQGRTMACEECRK